MSRNIDPCGTPLDRFEQKDKFLYEIITLGDFEIMTPGDFILERFFPHKRFEKAFPLVHMLLADGL